MLNYNVNSDDPIEWIRWLRQHLLNIDDLDEIYLTRFDFDDHEEIYDRYCHVKFEQEENIGALRCGHEYYVDCINKCFLRKNILFHVLRFSFSLHINTYNYRNV
ncbi:hypothetical protein R3W88_026707 [Solanum pinnatisectum]|uniref:Uncharacterized protein n=1 Tax=Solanum pinnatisectum TaxID=50273 RepID=A0AAV9LFB0_9SOLN|nr:hypothetical protein R3W88_026707 [Solanum pinnatisectum]